MAQRAAAIYFLPISIASGLARRPWPLGADRNESEPDYSRRALGLKQLASLKLHSRNADANRVFTL
jgi:hypothetical protein